MIQVKIKYGGAIMPRWLLKIEIEAQLGVVPDLPFLNIKHPKGLWEVHLENFRMELNCDIPLLIGYLLFNSDTLEDAETIGKKYSDQLIDFLIFTTKTQFRKKRTLCLFDWTPKIKERIGYVYKVVQNPHFPQLLLNTGLGKSVETLLASESNPTLAWALHKFAEAVSTDELEIKFELFWFTIETLASLSGNKDKVPDLCAICKEPLFCQNCRKVSEHRPYPSQRIKNLFNKHVKDQPDIAYDLTSKMRHTLLHGEDVAEIEKQSGFPLSELVDIVGKVAWASLMTMIVNLIFKDKPGHLEILDVSTFLDYEMVVKTKIAFSSPTDREPVFNDIPDLKIDIQKK